MSVAELALKSEVTKKITCPVNSYNEWDPLEEVIVGCIEHAIFPPRDKTIDAAVPEYFVPNELKNHLCGMKYPVEAIEAAKNELSELISILETAGVKVVRPDIIDFSVPYSTRNWTTTGFCSACPRDSLLVIGNEIIEAPMSWRSRYFEVEAYRNVLIDYFNKGARWSAAPKPVLTDRSFDQNYTVPNYGEEIRYVTTEAEPLFDAADFARCGKDIFVIRSNTTNLSGIRWLQRHLGEKYRIHILEGRSPQPMHIDTTFVPLKPGKLLVNPAFIDPNKLPDIFRNWDILIPPEPEPTEALKNPDPFMVMVNKMCSDWLSINVLMLDERRVIVEKSQKSLILAFEQWGFEPIPCPFKNYGPFGGAFHCATLDVKRKGKLESYF